MLTLKKASTVQAPAFSGYDDIDAVAKQFGADVGESVAGAFSRIGLR